VKDTAPDRHDILVTGASGFVGRTLCDSLAAEGRSPRRVVRSSPATAPDIFEIGDIGPDTGWSAALEGVRCVVHLAARTHVLRDTAADPLEEYRRINVLGTERLAREAVAHGVRRIIFLSSVKVNGERTASRPYTEYDPPQPEDDYGATKREAEEVLARHSTQSGLEVVILRPPLVYGPGVKGNFLRLLDFTARGIPLPLASIHNLRSLVYVGNLVDAIICAIDSPRAVGRTYLVSDGEDVSTPQLIRAIAGALDVKPRLLPFPPQLLQLAGKLSGRSGEISRLTGSLQVDSSHIREDLAWSARFSLRQGLAETARWYRAREETAA
jgi:UDP-N-acetyl-alpha-D-quinovosamine dehydrogenase